MATTGDSARSVSTFLDATSPNLTRADIISSGQAASHQRHQQSLSDD